LGERQAERHRPDRPSIMLQRWEQLMFLHWRFPPDQIQRTLPPGLTVDEFDGWAWVGLVPIFMRDVRPRFVPPLPWISDFLELNLRTYVFDPQGRPGIYFYSLDCDQPVVVEGARRLLHLRYEHAAMKGSADPSGEVTLESKRSGQAVTDQFIYRARSETEVSAEPGTLACFLIERYRLFAASADGRLTTIRVHHRPYSLRSVELRQWGTATFALAGLGSPADFPEHACAADPLDVEVFRPEDVPQR
jgi:uncharacterized protein YqjF (DUF2071 family)